MEHALLVRVLYRQADLPEEREPLPRRQLLRVAELRDRLARNELHHEVGPASRRRARVVHLGDRRVVHQRQGLPLGLEPRDDLPRVHSELDDLERDFSPHRLGLLGTEHGAEAALAEHLDDAVRPDRVADFSVGVRGRAERRGVRPAGVERSGEGTPARRPVPLQ